MQRVIITREQFEKIRQVFEEYNISQIVLSEESLSGIGPNTYIEFDPNTTVRQDITDYSTW